MTQVTDHLNHSIPPKLAVASVVGFLKGKSSIWVAQNIAGKKQNFGGHKFWARGYYLSTVGADEKVIRAVYVPAVFHESPAPLSPLLKYTAHAARVCPLRINSKASSKKSIAR